MQEKVTVTWVGSLKNGMGSISSESGAIQNAPYSFATRFENKKGTNPEELIAAAHAACFSMALSGMLGKDGFEAKTINASAIVTIEKVGNDWTIGKSHLEVTAEVPTK